MNFANIDVSSQPSSNIQTNGDRREYHWNKLILQVGIIAVVVLLLLALIGVFIYVFAKRQQIPATSVIDINLSTGVPLQTDSIAAVVILLKPCIEQSVQYTMAGKPWQNYSLYSIDASLIIPSALISFNVTIDPPNLGCTWSLDVFPMDGRLIPSSGPATNSVFGLYDQNQDLTVEYRNLSTLEYWSAGIGKFIVGMAGAWYGTAGIGCHGSGTMTICFSHP